MGHKNFLKSGYQYLSPTLGGEVEWKSYGEGFSVLLDAGGNAVARFDNKTWGGGKERVLEVVVDDDDDDGDGKGGRREEVMIEVLVSMLGLLAFLLLDTTVSTMSVKTILSLFEWMLI